MFKNLVLISLISLPLASENLLDIYNEALENDPQYKSSEYSLLAGKEFVVQGRAGLLPNVTLSGSTNWNEYYQFDELQSSYNNNSVTARLTQPLFRLDSWFNFKRSKKLTDASEADFAYAQQNLIIRTVEKYFGVLRAIDNLNAAVSEEKDTIEDVYEPYLLLKGFIQRTSRGRIATEKAYKHLGLKVQEQVQAKFF